MTDNQIAEHMDHANALVESARSAEALQEIEGVLDQNPDNLDALLLACDLHLDMKDIVQAEELFVRAKNLAGETYIAEIGRLEFALQSWGPRSHTDAMRTRPHRHITAAPQYGGPTTVEGAYPLETLEV